MFIHGRHTFNADEWRGFASAVPNDTQLIGVRIQNQDDMRLFRPRASTPVLRGTAILVTKRAAGDLKFADRVGEILMASPRTVSAPPLPFRSISDK